MTINYIFTVKLNVKVELGFSILGNIFTISEIDFITVL